ncbi:MAG: hypothetical protein E7062_04725 [Spirochaetaceae bacterium]|nr:hypothetical protein [Spirochaetaceae bacterium]
MKRSLKSWIFSTVIVFLVLIAVPLFFFFAEIPPVYCLLYLGIVALCFILYLFFFFYRPLQNIGDYIAQIAQGDFGIPIKKVPSMPFLTSVAENLNHFVTDVLFHLLENLKLEILQIQDSSNSFLTEVQQAMTISSRISLGSDSIGDKIFQLKKLLDDSLLDNEKITHSIDEYNDLLFQQSNKIDATAEILSSIQESLQNSIFEINKQKLETNQLISVTENGKLKVEETIKIVNTLSKGMGLLRETIKIIASVASRTNLLAMNAAIEAAHAGKTGAGFAVVAEEIRVLAETTSKQVSSISKSLNGMKEEIQLAVTSSMETGKAFEQINDEVEKFIQIFEKIIDYYTELCGNNNAIAHGFEDIQSIEKTVSSELEKIKDNVRENRDRIENITKNTDEIHEIVDFNTEKAVHLSHSQAPIYENTILSNKALEKIRKHIDFFRLPCVPISVWKADKTELWNIISNTFEHLDWTLRVLEYLHGKSVAVKAFVQPDSTVFGKWLYGEAKVLYSSLEVYQTLVSLNEEVHTRALLLIRLIDAKKEKEATIEFSELLECSRKIITHLNELKRYVIRHLGKNVQRETSQDLQTINKVSDISLVNQNSSSTDGVEDLEELEELEEL